MSVQEPSAEAYDIANAHLETVWRFVQHMTDRRHLDTITAAAMEVYGAEGRTYDGETISAARTVIEYAVQRIEQLISAYPRFDAFVVASPLLEFLREIVAYMPAGVIPHSDRPTQEVVDAYHQIGSYRYGQDLVVFTVGDTLRGLFD